MKALIVVDMQNDFMPGGALAVPGGDEIVGLINALMGKFDLVVASRDRHPPDHASFAANNPGTQVGDVIKLDGLDQIMWPAHCVKGTEGAQFVDGLYVASIHKIVEKGTDINIDSYSAFFDNDHRKATGLSDLLKENDVRQVYLVGVATDYCVKFTALDAAQLGFETCLIRDASRGVNLNPGDVNEAVADMVDAGVKVINSSEFI
jgi:nicotinamidase/pyrazinamidase